MLCAVLWCCRYWHRSLNPKKLIDIGFSALAVSMPTCALAGFLVFFGLPGRVGLAPAGLILGSTQQSGKPSCTSWVAGAVLSCSSHRVKSTGYRVLQSDTHCALAGRRLHARPASRCRAAPARHILPHCLNSTVIKGIITAGLSSSHTLRRVPTTLNHASERSIACLPAHLPTHPLLAYPLAHSAAISPLLILPVCFCPAAAHDHGSHHTPLQAASRARHRRSAADDGG